MMNTLLEFPIQIEIGDRSFESVLSNLEGEALPWFDHASSGWLSGKNPGDLATSFLEHARRSPSLRDLLADPLVDDAACCAALEALLRFYDSTLVPAAWAEPEKPFETREMESLALGLDKQAAKIRSAFIPPLAERIAGPIEMAAAEISARARHRRNLSAYLESTKGSPAGALKQLSSLLIEHLDLALCQVGTPADRHRRVAALASDFGISITGDQVRKQVVAAQDRSRRAGRRNTSVRVTLQSGDRVRTGTVRIPVVREDH